MSKGQLNFLKAELVQSRSAVDADNENAKDMLFSVELPIDDIFADPSGRTFTGVELIAYRVKSFSFALGDVNDVIFTTGTQGASYMVRNLYLDTAVPDASQPTTFATIVTTSNRWLASSTNVHYHRDVVVKEENTTTAGQGYIWPPRSNDMRRQWIDATDQDGQGPLIVTPRLIVRYEFQAEWQQPVAQVAFENEVFEFQMMYRIRRINKSEMFGLLRRQQPTQTLIRSGAAAFP